jgi:hypothetical protein
MSSPSDETSLAETGLHSGSAPVSHPSAGSGSRPGWLSSSGPGPSGESIAPGALLAERYRILGLVGRGGMGEVYRAEDLRLGQNVALKFLPAAVAEDPQRLAQFHHEVRIARQVSHRNVCRVYDIGEDHGRVFLTMELIDGEDLAVLLKRIGRFPEERATEIARQICAGLAAAHDLGVLHRDLKPANIMLDADGRVRITDFGLAGVAGSFSDVRSGTPAYMAPEQLAGQDVTERSDIFALGLVLFEIYTGRRAFNANSMAELLRQHDDGIRLTSAPSGPSLDPAVEQVIGRCLAPDPANRPASAIAVSAALPGGDPLAAALAAGETPSPAMVAAAGRVEPVPLAIGLSLLAFVVACLVGFIALRSSVSFHRHVPLPLSSAVLEDRARQVLDRFGYNDTPIDSVGEVFVGDDYLQWARTQPKASRWAALPTGRVPAIGFWYRTSPRLLIPRSENRQPSLTDPPFRLVGMAEALLDSRGALLEFHAVPPQRTPGTQAANPSPPGPPPSAIDWQIVFDAVGWPRGRFTPATPEWTPLVDTDSRVAWTGDAAGAGLDAAAPRGRHLRRPPGVRADGRAVDQGHARGAARIEVDRPAGPGAVPRVADPVVDRGLRPARAPQHGARPRGSAGRLARGRGADRRERRALGLLGAPRARLSPGAGCHPRRDRPGDAAGRHRLARVSRHRAVDPAPLADQPHLVEPAAVGRHPRSARRPRRADRPRIRRRLRARSRVQRAGADPVGGRRAGPDFNGVWALTTPRYAVALLIGGVSNALFNSLLLMVLYVVLRRLLRRPWLAAALVMALLALVIGAENGLADGAPVIALIVMLAVLMLLPLVRYGLLPFAVSFFSRQVLVGSPLTTDLGVWYATATWIVGATIIGLAVLAFKYSRAGAPTFGRLLEE